MPRSDDLFPSDWTTSGVDPKRLSEEVVETDRWDREDRARMLKEMPQFAASKKKLGEFARTGEPAISDMFAVFLKAEPEILDQNKVKPGHLVNRRILEQAMELDVTERLRRYTVNDDVQAALSCETIEPDMETLFDMSAEQQKRAEEFEQALAALAQARQDGHDLDDMVRRWADQEDLDLCETCNGTGQVPDPNAPQGEEDGDGDGQGDGEGEGEGAGGAAGDGQGDGEPADGDGGSGSATQPCPDCNGTGQGQGQGDGEGEGEGDGQPGDGKPSKGKGSAKQDNPGGGTRGTELTDEQRQQMEEFAKQQEEIRKRIEAAQAEAEAAGKDFEQEMNAIKATMRGAISDMLAKAEEAARESNEIAMTWGMEPGELQRLPAQERMDLAKRLNNERFRRVAKLFGPMRNMMLSEQQRKVIHTNEEVYDVTIGSDMARVLPQEILNLSPDSPAYLDFLRRFTEGKLLQYDMQGTERLAKGAIIFCEDGSGSMRGEREMWAKAVMLCLLHLARQQKRSFHLLHFGGPGQVKHIEFVKPQDYSLDRILDAAELFFGGGTDFATPMQQAMNLLDEEHKSTGRVKADVVFVTDDECYTTAEFMQQYLDFMHKVQSTTWGISVSGADRREGALDTMTEGKVATIKDFLTGEDIRGIFRGV